MYIKRQEDSILFYKACEESSPRDLAMATTESTLPVHLLDNVHVEATNLQGKLSAIDAVVWTVFESSCVTLEPFLSGFVESFRAGPTKAVGDKFRAGFSDAPIHADNFIDSITVHFLEVAVSDGGGGSIKS